MKIHLRLVNSKAEITKLTFIQHIALGTGFTSIAETLRERFRVASPQKIRVQHFQLNHSHL